MKREKNEDMFKVFEADGFCQCENTDNGICISWQKGRFNETQKISFDKARLEEICGKDSNKMAIVAAREMRKFGDYLAENYREYLF